MAKVTEIGALYTHLPGYSGSSANSGLLPSGQFVVTEDVLRIQLFEYE